MHRITDILIAALRAHWKANGNQYPLKFVLNTAQHRELVEFRGLGRGAINVDGPPPADDFMGAPLEVDDDSPGEIVNADGTRAPLHSPSEPAPQAS